MEILAITCASLAFLALIWMGWIDLKLWIIPNELVILYALTALPFHYAIGWLYGGWLLYILGAVVGGGCLLLIRSIGNWLYKKETMGLGDVKLIAAAGLWLGPTAVFAAMALGAFLGVVHAVTAAVIHKTSFRGIMLPAGPGFIGGIIIISLWTYRDLLL